MYRRLLYGIKRHTVEMLNLDVMGDRFSVLAVNYIFLTAYTTLESVFVNTLLYRITPDIAIVILYRGITYISAAAMMHLAAYIGQKKTPVLSAQLGAVFYLVMYLILLFGMNHMDKLMYLSAFFSGTAGAFYWSGHNSVVSQYTVPENRDVGLSVLGIIQGTMALSMPIISGSVISLMEKLFGSADLGYRIMFGIGIILVVMQIIRQRKLPPIVQKKHESELRLAFKFYLRNRSYHYLIAFDTLRGFREGALSFLLNMILFEIITSESLVGINAFLTGAASIIAAWAYGKIVTPKRRARCIVIATTALMAFCSILLFKASAPLVMLFAVANAFGVFFLVNCAYNCTLDVVSQSDLARKCLAESMAIREIFLAAGRVAGLLVVMAFPPTMRGRIHAILLLTLSQYLMAMFIKLTDRYFRRKEQAPGGGRA